MTTTEPATRRVSLRHVSALDGLRGMAVAGVLLFHGGHLTGGYLGVDLFFVLSGFLITSLLLSEAHDTEHVRLGGFWARRARRLLPALGGLMAGIALYYLLIAKPTELAGIRGDALATLGYFANWRGVFTGQNYWALFRAPSPLEHTWSLAIEEQFYLVWPLIFVGLLAHWKRAVPKAVLVTALCLAAVSAALMFVLYDPANTVRDYYGTDTRAAGILLGAALAAWFAMRGPARTRRSRIAVEIAGIAGVAALAVMWTSLDGQSERLYHGGFLLAGVAAVGVIAAAWQPEPGLLSRVLSFKPLCLLGLISYGVYLWHWPVDLVVDHGRTGLSGWPLFGVQLLVTLAIAITSYQMLEMPIRRGAVTKRQWQIVLPALAAVIAVTYFAASSITPSAALFKYQVATWQDPPRVRPVQAGIGTTVGPVLVVGDSVALSMASGLRNAGLEVVPYGYPARRVVCGAIRVPSNVYKPPEDVCSRDSFWGPEVDKVHPKVVLVETGGYELYDVRPTGTATWLVPGTAAWARYFANQVQAAVDRLGATGARVVFLDYPCAQVPPATPAQFQHVGLFNAAHRRAGNEVLAQVAARNRGRMQVLGLDKFVCPTGKYQNGLAGVNPMRVDGVHFSRRGSNVVGRWVARQLAATTPAPTSAAAGAETRP